MTARAKLSGGYVRVKVVAQLKIRNDSGRKTRMLELYATKEQKTKKRKIKKREKIYIKE